MVSKETDRAARRFVVERLHALAEKQTEPKRFYSYDTLRGMGIAGRPDIAACVGELRQHGIIVLFPGSPKRDKSDPSQTKRGMILCKTTAKELLQHADSADSVDSVDNVDS